MAEITYPIARDFETYPLVKSESGKFLAVRATTEGGILDITLIPTRSDRKIEIVDCEGPLRTLTENEKLLTRYAVRHTLIKAGTLTKGKYDKHLCNRILPEPEDFEAFQAAMAAMDEYLIPEIEVAEEVFEDVNAGMVNMFTNDAAEAAIGNTVHVVENFTIGDHFAGLDSRGLRQLESHHPESTDVFLLEK